MKQGSLVVWSYLAKYLIVFFLFIFNLFLHLLCNLGVVLLEALAHALLRGHPLEDAAVEASGFLGGKRLGGEVIDAGGEAVLDKTAESLEIRRKDC